MVQPKVLLQMEAELDDWGLNKRILATWTTDDGPGGRKQRQLAVSWNHFLLTKRHVKAPEGKLLRDQ